MKTTAHLLKIVVALVLSSIVSSCGTTDHVVSGNLIQKRKYNSGWYLSSFAKKTNITTSQENADTHHHTTLTSQKLSVNNGAYEPTTSKPLEPDFSQTSASTGKPAVSHYKAINKYERLSVQENECDIIILKNGQEIRAKVLEVGQTEIRYKMCDNPEGPTFTKSKSEVSSIKYPNGTSTEISPLDDYAPAPSQDDTSGYTAAGTGASGKSQIVALLLCIIIGIVGIHRFYLGYIGIGILQIVTLGMCGLWTLIDLIRIITGDLQPKNGEYTETL